MNLSGVSDTHESSMKGAPRLVVKEDTLLMWHIALKMTSEPCWLAERMLI